MRQPACKQLYAYWDRLRNGRAAPRRFEIEPARIPTLLPDGPPAKAPRESAEIVLCRRRFRVLEGGLNEGRD